MHCNVIILIGCEHSRDHTLLLEGDAQYERDGRALKNVHVLPYQCIVVDLNAIWCSSIIHQYHALNMRQKTDF